MGLICKKKKKEEAKMDTPLKKIVARPIVERINFQEGLAIILAAPAVVFRGVVLPYVCGEEGNTTPLKATAREASKKGENKWESFGSRWTGNWRAPIDCSRTEYSIFLKEKAYPNVGN